MRAVDGSRYQVGNFLIDTARYRVTCGAAVVPVEPKVFDLLVHLIRHHDRVLTREELFEAVWDGREVSDATLSNHVKSARKVLGDSGELQQVIQTVRGRGYQFIAPVRELADGVVAGGEDPPEQHARRGVWRPRWLLAAGVALVVLGTLVPFGLRYVTVPAQPVPERPYLLAVPFGVSDNATEDHRLFADQLAREVIDNLRKISGLRVVPQASAFRFRQDRTHEHLQAVLPAVRFVLDGEISVAPDGTLRINPKLVDLRQDLDVWGRPFTVRVDNGNFFETAAGIASAVAAALKVEILKDEQRALAEIPDNPRAYAPYSAGWREMERFTHASVRRAVELFDRAIERDPTFLAAYLARSDALRIIFTYFEPPSELLPQVRASLDAVLAREPDSARALSSLGLTQVMAWQWKDAWNNLSRAKALDPSLALTELGFALYYSALGEKGKVRESLARAHALDPLNTELADWGNWALFMVGEYEASREWGEKQMREHPDNGFVFCGAGISAYLQGDTERGVALLEKGVELADRAPVALIMLAQGYGYAGRRENVLPLLEEAGRANIYMCPYETAVAYMSLGDEAGKAKAIELLHESIGKRSNCLMFLRNDPRWEPVRDDPRFAALLPMVGLDDAQVAAYRR